MCVCVCVCKINEKLQQNVDSSSEWYRKNRLCVNASKTLVMLIKSKCSIATDKLIIKIDDIMLDTCNVSSFLGKWVDETLTWDSPNWTCDFYQLVITWTHKTFQIFVTNNC